MVATFKKVATIRKIPNIIKANEPPCTSIRSDTYQKKLFLINSGKAFHDSQLPALKFQSIKV